MMSQQAFDAHAAEYDAWYNSEVGSRIFSLEVDCLQPLLHGYQRPYLEVGVGSGHFAQALGIEYGVDPASALVQMAQSRGIQVFRATGENLPFTDRVFGAILITLTLCFVADPEKVLEEARRVLLPGGGLVLGLILKGSPWAESYALKGEQGHPIYSRARFFSKEEMENLFRLAGFESYRYRSILLQPPGQGHYLPELPVEGYHRSAGFVALASRRAGG